MVLPSGSRLVLALAVLSAALACGDSASNDGGSGGSAPQGGSGGSNAGGSGGMDPGGSGGGDAGSGGAMGGSGGTGSGSPCGQNDVLPGGQISLEVSGNATFQGTMRPTQFSGCRLGVQSENRDGSFTYADATAKFRLTFGWKLSVDPRWDGKDNTDLVGQTIPRATMGGDVSPLVSFDDGVPKGKYYAQDAVITIEELDADNVKGCIHGFTSWKRTDGTGSLTVKSPILFNCEVEQL